MRKILFFLIFFTSSCSTTESLLPDFFPEFVSKYFEKEVKPYSGLPNYTPGSKVDLIWEVKFSSEAEDADSYLSFFKLNDELFVPTHDKKIHVVSSESGVLEKSIDTKLDIFSGLIVDSELIYFGSKQDTVTAIKRSDNTILWQRIMSSEVMAISKIVNDIIYVRTNDSNISAIDIKTGKFLWINSQISAGLSIRGSSEPIISDSKVYSGFEDGRIAAYNALNGDIIWQSQLSGIKAETIIDRLNDIDGSMIIDKGVLYAISYQGSIAALDSFSGQILWSREASSIDGLGSSYDNIFYTDDNGILWCLDKYSGRSVWKQDSFKKRLIGAPIFLNDFILVGDIENYIHIINADDGTIAGRIQLKNSIQSIFTESNFIFLLDKGFNLNKYEINSISKIEK